MGRLTAADPRFRPEPLARRGRLLLLSLLVLSSVLLAIEPGHVPLFEPDESRYAEIPREMLATGDWVTPRLNGLAYFEKPPLHYWAVAVSMRLFGESEFAVRLPVKLAALGMVVATFLFAGKRWGERVGLLAGLILATSFLLVALSRVNSIDTTLSFALTLATFSFAAFQEAEKAGDRVRARLALYGLHVSCAAAVMLKGLVGLVLPGGAILLWAVSVRRLHVVPRLFSPGPLAVFLLLSVPWHVALAQRESDFLTFYFVNEHFDRFFKSGHGRSASPFFFGGVLLGGFVPWVAFFGRLLEAWPGRTLEAWRERATEGLLFVWVLLVVLFFSASRSKLIPYIEPVWPALAVLLAVGLEKARQKGASFALDRRLLALGFGVLLVGVAVIAWGAGAAASFGVPVQAGLVSAGLLAGFLVNLRWGRRGAWSKAGQGLSTEALVLATAAPWLALVAGAVFALPPVARAVTPWPLVAVLKRELRPGDLLLQRGHYLQAAVFYSKRLTPITQLGESELKFGASRPDAGALVLTPEQFVERWNGPARVLAVVHRDWLGRFGPEASPRLVPAVFLARAPSAKHYLLANRP